ncbi:isochorismatase family protein [Archaeoglobus veneficus]|uniref:Isochorismatase hydrolase n=1 Tax=Archaeoglobus veneficus (strain DSM 11195 / SNP6) TaxID=693661 RepID=F2KMR2_ARCVS|nr:isochorismatase family protein [Archaeoglobus veneficus]AEA46086.1 isochorismatase hydrolase [Archaeoglobus veneficus SNP6]
MHLVVIDMQERLAPHVSEIEDVTLNVVKLVKAFRILGLKITVTEQQKLGETVEDVKNAAGSFEVVKKTSFSCMGEQSFLNEIMGSRKFLLAGIETHICVLQTALDMLKYGFEVHVAVDATGSRKDVDKQAAVMRMMQEGVKITTTEAAIYECLKDAKHERFKDILEVVKMSKP